MKNLALLGATGSIGTQVLKVISGNPEYRIQSLSIGHNLEAGIRIIREFHPSFVSVQEKSDAATLAKLFPNLSIGWGELGLSQAATFVEPGDYLINAVVGVVGLLPTIKAIEKGINILLANKETMVVGGEIISDLLRKHRVTLLPIDSEHSAIFQCLRSGQRSDVSKIIITASGGSLREYGRDRLEKVTVSEALNHPNWKMGAKITIDSATMVNKGLEVMEAHHLFHLPYDQIETVLHPESLVHSMVEFADGSIIAQLGVPNMEVPIQYALTYPKKQKNDLFQKMDFSKAVNLRFQPMDFERYPILELAYEVGKQGGVLPAVYNAANEAAVRLFLDNQIRFTDIEKIIVSAVANFKNIKKPTLEQILKTDASVKEQILRNHEVNNE
ncbi:MAG TPA: 1-deoxy-D-xylulose-5-phosphate reductoisomerase [Acholeplasmatales bacterium]|nr:1-deoxy-D-xylulose-5-phosphate reductoisomerase [Acholeplasmatales bacterium]